MDEPTLAPTEVMTLGSIRMKYVGRHALYGGGLGQEELGPGAWIKPTIVVGVIMVGMIAFGMFFSTPAPTRRHGRT